MYIILYIISNILTSISNKLNYFKHVSTILPKRPPHIQAQRSRLQNEIREEQGGRWEAGADKVWRLVVTAPALSAALCGNPAAWCSVVQCSAVWCSVLQRVTVCCSVLLCVAACYCVLQAALCGSSALC